MDKLPRYEPKQSFDPTKYARHGYFVHGWELYTVLGTDSYVMQNSSWELRVQHSAGQLIDRCTLDYGASVRTAVETFRLVPDNVVALDGHPFKERVEALLSKPQTVDLGLDNIRKAGWCGVITSGDGITRHFSYGVLSRNPYEGPAVTGGVFDDQYWVGGVREGVRYW